MPAYDIRDPSMDPMAMMQWRRAGSDQVRYGTYFDTWPINQLRRGLDRGCASISPTAASKRLGTATWPDRVQLAPRGGAAAANWRCQAALTAARPVANSASGARASSLCRARAWAKARYAR